MSANKTYSPGDYSVMFGPMGEDEREYLLQHGFIEENSEGEIREVSTLVDEEDFDLSKAKTPEPTKESEKESIICELPQTPQLEMENENNGLIVPVTEEHLKNSFDKMDECAFSQDMFFSQESTDVSMRNPDTTFEESFVEGLTNVSAPLIDDSSLPNTSLAESNPGNNSICSDLDDTIEMMEKVLALADLQEERERQGLTPLIFSQELPSSQEFTSSQTERKDIQFDEFDISNASSMIEFEKQPSLIQDTPDDDENPLRRILRSASKTPLGRLGGRSPKKKTPVLAAVNSTPIRYNPNYLDEMNVTPLTRSASKAKQAMPVVAEMITTPRKTPMTRAASRQEDRQLSTPRKSPALGPSPNLLDFSKSTPEVLKNTTPRKTPITRSTPEVVKNTTPRKTPITRSIPEVVKNTTPRKTPITRSTPEVVKTTTPRKMPITQSTSKTENTQEIEKTPRKTPLLRSASIPSSPVSQIKETPTPVITRSACKPESMSSANNKIEKNTNSTKKTTPAIKSAPSTPKSGKAQEEIDNEEERADEINEMAEGFFGPVKNKRVEALRKKARLFSPSPPRPKPNASVPRGLLSTNLPKDTKASALVNSPRNIVAFKSGGQKPGIKHFPVNSPVVNYIYNSAPPAKFQNAGCIASGCDPVTSTSSSVNRPTNAKTGIPICKGKSTTPQFIPNRFPKYGSMRTPGTSEILPTTTLTEAGYNSKQSTPAAEKKTMAYSHYSGTKALKITPATKLVATPKENFGVLRHTGSRDSDASIVNTTLMDTKFAPSSYSARNTPA